MAVAAPKPVNEDLSIVMLGSFNPAIFHPEWFIRQKLIGDFDPAGIKVISADVTEVSFGPFRLFSTHDRLILHCANMVYAEALHDLVNGLLKLLSHTPVTAVGINQEAAFPVSSVDHWHAIGHALAPKEKIWNRLCVDPGMQLLTIQAPVKWVKPLVENLSVLPLPSTHVNHPGIICKTNLHFQIIDDEEQPSAMWASRFLDEHWVYATGRLHELATMIFNQIPS